jgi:hypothetical protein
LTDSHYGGTTLTYDAANQWFYGTLTVTFTAPVSWDCPPTTTFTIRYTLHACGQLSVNWDTRNCGYCFGTSFSNNSYVMPSDPVANPCVVGSTAGPLVNPLTLHSSNTGDPDGSNAYGTCTISAAVPLNWSRTAPVASGTFTTIYPGPVTWTVTE